MPRKNQLLRYLKLDRLGRLTYTRQIPPALRPFLGGRATIRRTLGVDSSDCSNPTVLSAYAAVHGEIDGLITQAKAQLAGALDVIAGNTGGNHATSGDIPPVTACDCRYCVAGMANIRHSVEHQQNADPELANAIRALAIKAVSGGISAVSVGDFASLARPILIDLGIQPSPADMERIGNALFHVSATDGSRYAEVAADGLLTATIARDRPHLCPLEQ